MIDVRARETVILAAGFSELVAWYRDVLGFSVVNLFEDGFHYCNLETPSGIKIGIADAQDAVPEQANLLFQLPGGVDHTVGPVALVGHDAGHVTPAVHIPLHHVHIHVGLLFRMEQFFNRGFVANGGPPFKLLIRCAESGSPHQVGHQQDVVACHSRSS